MTTSNTDLYKYSKLSTAGYVDLSGAANLTSEELRNRANVQDRMPTALGDQFFVSDGWRVVSDPRHPPTTAGDHNDPGSGFAATLFQRGTTGEKVLSIRGTEARDAPLGGSFLRDLEADVLQIGMLGIAISQTVSMFNLLQRMLAEPGRTDVLQLTLRTSIAPPPVANFVRFQPLPLLPVYEYYWLEANNNGIGVGGISATDTITVVGHSLGGHLAAMAHRLFPGVFPRAIVFNSARYDPLSSAKLTSQFLDLFRPFGAAPGEGFSNVLMYDSEDQAPGDDISGVASLITGKLFGPLTQVTVEANTHVIEPFMDSLSLQALMASMSDNLSSADTGKVLEAISNTERNSDERLLQALHRLLKGISITPLTEFQASLASAGDIRAREEFYSGLVALETLVKDNSRLRLESLLGRSAAELTLLASSTEGIGYRYALSELNPFAVIGADYATLHNVNGELDLYNLVTGTGFTETYLADRSEMLKWKNLDYAMDGQRVLRSTQLVSYQYIDTTLKDAFGNDLMFSVNGRQLGSVSIPAKVIFGGDIPDSLFGGHLAVGDHFFGGGGDDYLDGQGGNDYLEGGADHDTLLGGDGNDVLFAGAGDDTLEGGAGQDVLDGGPGFDTYRYFAADGPDTIVDSDGNGQIFYDGVLLTGGAGLGPDLWESADGRFQFMLTAESDGAQTLSVSGSGTLLVRDFAPGKLGISLEETTPQAPTAPTGGFEIRGDQAYQIFLITDSEIRNNPPDGYRYVSLVPQSQYPNLYYLVSELLSVAGEGYILRDPTRPWTAGTQWLHGTDGADHMFTSNEGDNLLGFGGDDHLVGGVAGDGLGGGDGNDFIEGGAFFDMPLEDWLNVSATYPDGEVIEGGRDDVLGGGSGDDVLFGSVASDWDALLDPETPAAGHKGDWLGGYDGEDELYGSTGDDVLQGGGDTDLLVGGPGADVLLGDDAFGFGHIEYPAAGLWSVERGNSPFDIQFFPVSAFPWSTWPDYYKFAGADDTLFGGTGADILIGQLGDDMLFGEAGNDVLAGWEGDDTLLGGDGDDIMAGDFGSYEQANDRLVGFTYHVPAGFLDFTTGSSGSVDQTGRDYLDGGAGNDVLFGEGGDDVVLGGEGDDELWGDAAYLPEELHGADFLDAGGGDDMLYGGGDDDTLISGWGDDALDGGEGSDTYVFASGDGADFIADTGIAGTDVLIIEDYTQSDVTIHRGADGSVLIIGANGDAVTIQGFAGNDSSGVERIQFTDGTVLDQETIGALPIAEGSIGGDGWTTASEADDVVETFGLPTGNAGGFVLFDAGAGNDTVFGDASAVVYGNAGDDRLFGGDTLIGGDGDDQLSGAVRLIGGEGNDELLNGTILDGGPGNDFLDGGYGASRYLIAPSDLGFDIISDSGESQDAFLEDFYSSLGIFDWRERRFPTQLEYVVFEFGSFATLEEATAEVEETFGFTWDEALARGFAAVLDPLPSPPQIAAHDWSALAPFYATGLIEADAIEFAQGIDSADLTLSWGEVSSTSPVSGALEAYTTLDVSWGAGSVARIVIPHGEDPLGTGVEEFCFANGWVVSMQDMVTAAPPAPSFDPQFGDNLLIGTALGEGIIGRAGDDSIFGGGGDDFLEGGEGTDILRGEEGADSLSDRQGNNFFDGGTGDDFIYADGAPNFTDGGINFVVGGAGNDWIGSYAAGNVIAFNIGDGQDIIYVSNALTLSFGGGVDPASLSLSQDFADLVLTIGAGDSIRLTGQSDPQAWPQITLQLFGSVHLFDFNAVITDFYAALAADPALAPFSLDGVLQSHETSVSETNAIGGALAYQYGTVGNLDTLSDAAIDEVLADPDFGIAAQIIQIPGHGNTAPALANAIGPQAALEDTAFSFTLPAGTFVDADAGDVITISATLADGSALPDWLGFDAVTRSFGGTPANEDVGALEVAVTATDTSGLSAAGTFRLEVVNVNDAPDVATRLADQSANQNSALAFHVSQGTFADVDTGDSLTFGAALADGSSLPDWLAFDPDLGSFSGTPSEFDVGDVDIRVTATDNAGATAADTFTLSVSDASTVNETHVGTRRHDLIVTGFANDLIDAGRGDDIVHAGAGRDIVFGGRGEDLLYGGAGNDRLYGGKGEDQLDGGLGHDLLYGGGGGDRLEGGAGADLLSGGAGRDLLTGGAGENLLIGGAGRDTITGGPGGDVFLVNLDDGRDELHLTGAALEGNQDVLSLGGGIGTGDISLKRDQGDLIVEARDADKHEERAQVVLKNWYRDAGDHQTVTTLQLFDGGTAVTYDFLELVARFDAETQGQHFTRRWSAAQALPAVQLTSGAEPLGWDIAREYAMSGTVLGDEPLADEDAEERAALPGADWDPPLTLSAREDLRRGSKHERDTGRDDRDYSKDKHESLADVLEAYLAQKPQYEFEAFVRELEHSDRRGELLSAQDIAHRWQVVGRYGNGLLNENDDDARRGAVPRFNEQGLLESGAFGGGIGYTGSTGMARGIASLRALQGLEEGFQRLRS